MLTRILAATAAPLALFAGAAMAQSDDLDLETVLEGGQVNARAAVGQPPQPESYRGRPDYRPGRDRTIQLTCRSNGRYERCPVGGRIDRVRFVASRSSNNCELGRDWGVEPNAIWADNGCRAYFELRIIENGYGYGRDRDDRYGRPGDRDRDYGYGRDYDRVQYVTCESENYRRELCRLPRGFSRVRLEDRRSDRPCREGREWGVTREGVWVDNGCRAVFSYVVRY